VDPLYLLLEVSAGTFFLGAALAALRRGRLPFLELISAAAFGILLEEGDQLVFETYHYSSHWILAIDRAPVVIGLTWALILAGAMRLTDALGVRRRYAPFVDAVLAISLDLAFDAIAIRMGLWTWRGIGPSEGWFGVPAGNFYAWLFVTLSFSAMTRWVRDGARGRPAFEWLQLAVPMPAWILLLVGLTPFCTPSSIRSPAAASACSPLRWPPSSPSRHGASGGRTGSGRTASALPSSTCAWRSGRASRSMASSSCRSC